MRKQLKFEHYFGPELSNIRCDIIPHIPSDESDDDMWLNTFIHSRKEQKKQINHEQICRLALQLNLL